IGSILCDDIDARQGRGSAAFPPRHPVGQHDLHRVPHLLPRNTRCRADRRCAGLYLSARTSPPDIVLKVTLQLRIAGLWVVIVENGDLWPASRGWKSTMA